MRRSRINVVSPARKHEAVAHLEHTAPAKTDERAQRGNISLPTRPSKTACASRFIRTFKEECAWQHRFDNLTAARATVARYIEHYNTQRTHSALKYNTPRQTYLTLCNPPHQQAA